MEKHYDVIVVGGGIAGLTATAYLSRANKKVLLIEKEPYVGGLVGSFSHQGFTFDRGARSIESSGIVKPMLKDLGIELDFLESPVKMIFDQASVTLHSTDDIKTYESTLKELYPTESMAIDALMNDIRKVMGYMDVLYGIDNPLFMKMPPDMGYLTKTLLPWLFRFFPNIRKAMKYQLPILEHIKKYTKNTSLIDLIAQHFFEATPAFFALSYFTLYLDYQYPRGGTGALPISLEKYILNHAGTIQCNTEAKSIHLDGKKLIDHEGNVFTYDAIIWAADQKVLYNTMDEHSTKSSKFYSIIKQKRTFLSNKKGADSVLTLYLGLDIPKEVFESKFGPHAFVTPNLEGLSTMPLELIRNNGVFVDDKQQVFNWVNKLLELTTYEVSIPCLRDEQLSPSNQTGVILSVLFDYDLAKHIQNSGWYSTFKTFVQDKMIAVIETKYELKLNNKIIFSSVATPLTIERYTLNTGGSLSGWSFGNRPFPSEYKIMRVANAVNTQLPYIYQAGQWSFNPAGIPIAVMTGKLASDKVLKSLKKLKQKR